MSKSNRVPDGRMLRRVWAPLILLLATVLSACSQTSPAPNASQSPQPLGGTGWTLLRTDSRTLLNEGVAIAPFGEDQYLASITVSGPGADGCGAPVLMGFHPAGTTLVPEIVRSPASDSCATVSAVTFYVAVDRRLIPDTVDQLVLGEPCEGSGCTAPVPRPS